MGTAANRTADETALPAIAKRPTFIVHRLNAELARICNPLFRRLGVDLITARILAVLLEQGRVYVGDVVDLMALPQSTVSHQIKRLEGAGLVNRQADKTDNRAYFVSLTRKGRDVAVQCSQISATIYAEVFKDVDEATVFELIDHLEGMEARLKSLTASSLRL